MQTRPLKRADALRQVLEDEIATGRLPPGSRLEEVVLAERFGVSRTPIREALQKLSASGLVELRPRRSAVVASLSLERLLEMFEVMAETEAICGRLAARRMQSDERAALLAQHERCGEAGASGDADLYYAENAAFHALIYAGTHNAFLMEEARRLRRRLQPYRRLQLRVHGRLEASFREHGAITAAIAEGKGEEAADLLRAHVSLQGDRFGDWLASLNAAATHGGEHGRSA